MAKLKLLVYSRSLTGNPQQHNQCHRCMSGFINSVETKRMRKINEGNLMVQAVENRRLKFLKPE
ncbi:MAG: hypothetical protein ACTHLE_17715 [Agriterribacter sp.]